MSMFLENSDNWSSNSPHSFPSTSATQSQSISFFKLPVFPPQSLSEGLSDRSSSSHLCFWFCSDWHLLQASPCRPAPTGTCHPVSHVPVTPPSLNSHSVPTPEHASVPKVDGSPDSLALHGNNDENESDQDIMITGYNQPSKSMTKVILSENPPLLATLPQQVAKDMMCKGTVHHL